MAAKKQELIEGLDWEERVIDWAEHTTPKMLPSLREILEDGDGGATEGLKNILAMGFAAGYSAAYQSNSISE